ncbi:hypothetical protein F4776DRAFT_453285 [Hypoxylon sp. NC0597]|nr:hypothetical protein F4776DRAFT_453285 [Hypoxylon sp. NC0597]
MENRPFRFSPKACLQKRGRHDQASALRTPLQTGLVLSTLCLALPSSPPFGLLKPSPSLDKGQGFLLDWRIQPTYPIVILVLTPYGPKPDLAGGSGEPWDSSTGSQCGCSLKLVVNHATIIVVASRRRSAKDGSQCMHSARAQCMWMCMYVWQMWQAASLKIHYASFSQVAPSIEMRENFEMVILLSEAFVEN